MKFLLSTLIAFVAFFNVYGQTAAFSVNVEQGCIPLQIQCTDQSLGATSWNWSINTPIPLTSTDQNPSFTITVSGNYTISLIINGGASSSSQSIIAFKSPEANFVANPSFGCAPLQVQFTDISVLGDAPILNWEWDLGVPPILTVQNPTVIYNQNSTLDVTLVVTDANGCNNFVIKNNFIQVDKAPTASFTVSPTSGIAPFTPIITNTTTINQPDLVFNWFFPGGSPTSVNQFDPGMITYNQMGTYFMNLSVLDNGCADDTSVAIFVLPSIDVNLIQSQVFFDVNENKVFDEHEHGIGNLETNISSSANNMLTNENGFSIFYGDSGVTYILNWVEHPDWVLTTDSLEYHISLPQDSVQTYYFGLYPAIETNQVNPVITSANTRCNSTVDFYLTVLNSGTLIANGSVELVADPSTDFLSYSIEPIDSSENKLIWTIDDLWPGNSFNVQLGVRMPNENFTGDTITFLANTYLEDDNENVVDTITYMYKSVVLCSYDPNDKQVNPLGTGDESLTLKKETLVYTVRFQNTGNDVAFDVTIIDILDADLDLSTFKVIGSSHTVQASLNQSTREAQFYFPNINLPDSSSNLEGSQGYVTFSIKPKSGLADNTVVENSANIIFDNNPAIVTNTVVSTLVDEIGNEIPNALVNHSGELIQISIYPNPFTQQAIFSIEGNLTFHYDLIITDVRGREVLSYLDQSEKQVIISKGKLAKGLYFVNLYESGQTELIASQKIILE